MGRVALYLCGYLDLSWFSRYTNGADYDLTGRGRQEMDTTSQKVRGSALPCYGAAAVWVVRALAFDLYI